MSATSAGISEADWQATPTAVRALILVQQAELQAQQQEIEQLRGQLAVEGVEISAAASLEVAEHCVDPALLRQIVGVLSSGDDGLVLELAVATARKQASRSERDLTSGGMMSLGPVSDRIRAETGHGTEPCVNRVTGLG